MTPPQPPGKGRKGTLQTTAFKFILLFGVVSLFADFVYEGARSIIGPYLAVLGASGTVVGIVAGFGELLGYALRLISGRLSEWTGKFWPITILGYAIQMTAVPLLALAGSWQLAAALLIVERIGKALRNPPQKAILSHAAKEVGYGWGFGVHEALDQLGALFGPLVVAAVVALRGEYAIAFAVLLVPALLNLSLLLIARLLYPRPEEMEGEVPDLQTHSLPRAFWVYLAGAALVAAGFVDFSLMAYHFQKADTFPPFWIPLFYALAMAVSGAGSLAFGRLFDRLGLFVLVPLTLLTTLSAPLAFLGGPWLALAGCALWGLGMGGHDSLIPAAVATMVPPQRRASAYGLFTAGFGLFWFLGSAVLGVLYDVSLPALIVFSVAAETAAVPLFLAVSRTSHEPSARRSSETHS
jgi:MFS family permease